jgi:hypothetical protein
MASFNKFNAFVADVANKVHNLGSDTLKIMLTNSAPVATNAVKTDITEISAGNGYSAGGVAVTGITSSQASGTYKLVSSADPVVTASGAVGPFRYAVLYNSTAASGNLIGYWDYGSAVTLANTDTFTIDLDQTNGILQIA